MQKANRTYKRSVATANIRPRSTLIAVFSITCCLLSAAHFSFSQTSGSFPSDLSLPQAVFNRTFIKENKIKLISASVVDKPDGEIIRDKGLAENFVFDTSGNLVRHYYNEITALQKTETDVPAVYSKRGRVVKKSYTKIDYNYQYDTLGTEFFYTTNGFLKMQRICIGDFYLTTYYEYFGDGLVSKQTKCKETNVARKGEPFKLGMQTILSEEKCEYEVLSPTQVRKKFLNDEGKPYKQGIINYKDKRIIDESYEFVVGFIRSGTTYTYDAHGRLIEKTTYDNSSGNNQEKVTYEYDDKGNTTKEKRFKNGTQTNEIIFLYEAPPSLLGNNKGSALLTSQADRQIQQSSIKIVKYEYEFY